MLNHIKKSWIDALRSDEYEQIQGSLEDKTSAGYIGNCCLGVLVCVLEKEHSNILDKTRIKISRYHDLDKRHHALQIHRGNIIENDGGIGISLRTLLGISEADQKILINMNDREQLSFNTIADYIENNL